MRFVDLEQGSRPWLAWRRGGLGGSDAAAIAGVSPWKTADQLFAELTGQAAPELANYAMRRGTRLEPVARAAYEDRFGMTVPPACVEHDELDWMRASLDGLDITGELLLEVKWPNHEAHAQALAGEVPPYYLLQVQHQLFVSGADVAHYWSCSEHQKFARADRFALVEVLPDLDVIGELLVLEMLFWEKLQEVRHAA